MEKRNCEQNQCFFFEYLKLLSGMVLLEQVSKSIILIYIILWNYHLTWNGIDYIFDFECGHPKLQIVEHIGILFSKAEHMKIKKEYRKYGIVEKRIEKVYPKHKIKPSSSVIDYITCWECHSIIIKSWKQNTLENKSEWE